MTLRDQFALERAMRPSDDSDDAFLKLFEADLKGTTREALDSIAAVHMQDRASREPIKAFLTTLTAVAAASGCSSDVGTMLADWRRDLDDLDAGRSTKRFDKAKRNGAPPASDARRRMIVATVVAVETLQKNHELDVKAARKMVAGWLNGMPGGESVTVPATRGGGHGRRERVTAETLKQWSSSELALGDDPRGFRQTMRDAFGQMGTTDDLRESFERLVFDELNASDGDSF